MNYQHQLSKVIEFIGKHLDEELTLTQLSDIACFSKYHFHRLFTAYTGLSLQHYIRWLRLKRATHQLIVDKDQSIINIAIEAGFESHEAFSRAFKQTCGISPSEFRQKSSWQAWEQPPYQLPLKEDMTMNVTSRWREITTFLTNFTTYQLGYKVLFPFHKQFPALHAA